MYRALLGGGHPSSNGSIFGWGLLNSGIPCPWTHVAMTSCLIAFVPSHLILVYYYISYDLKLDANHVMKQSGRTA